jgi:cytochrome c-type biogenesis protein CcmF
MKARKDRKNIRRNTMIELSRYALLFAFVVTLYIVVVIALGLKKKDKRYIESGYRGLYLTCFFFTFASLGMISAFVNDQFQIEYVSSYSERALPTFYKVTGLWAGQDGSLVFWGWLLSVFSAIVIYQNRKDFLHLYLPYVAIILTVTQMFFLVLSNFVTAPFGLISQIPADGNGLNPLLQNTGLVFHPPSLYIGFVGFTIPFAFAMAALITGELDSWWIRKTRIWTIFSWSFLSLGVVLGGWWAYRELGWGGVWAWDPVENSSIMPWLTSTAFLHSVMIQERRNMLKVWNMVLIVSTFSLSIFGTFLTRSGVVASVHAFGQSSVGYTFLGFLIVVLAFAIYFISKRYKTLREQDNKLDSLLSRESTFLYNNLILVGIAFSTFWGTVFPILAEAVKGVKTSVGPPFFNTVNAPLFLILLIIMGICPLIGWRSSSWKKLKRLFIYPTILMAVSIPPLLLLGITGIMPIFFYAFCVFVLVTLYLEFYKGAAARRSLNRENIFQALGRLISRNRRRYGGYIIHIGIVMITIGLVGYGYFQKKEDASLMPNERLVLGNYAFAYDGIESGKKRNYDRVTATIGVYKNGEWLTNLYPEKRFYKSQMQPTTEVDIRSGLFEDVYLILAGWDGSGSITLIAIINPMLKWVWIGTGVFLIGSFIAITPRRRTQPSFVTSPEVKGTAEEKA